MRILFVTWDGPQVSYLESLFLPIFSRLIEEGFAFQVLQFTWGDASRIGFARLACEQKGIGYQVVSVWRYPRAVGALLTALAGARHVSNAVHTNHIDMVLARSTLPALASMLAVRNNLCPIVFDADGLPLDERVDFAGQSPNSIVHRLLRDVEAQALRRAAVVLTRSTKALEIMHARAGAGTSAEKFHIVGNGRDTTRFHPADALQSMRVRSALGLSIETPLVVYAGSVGPQYCMDEMFRLFLLVHARRPDSHFLILTGSPETVPAFLEKYPHIHRCVTILSVAPTDVAQYLGCSDLGLALRQPSFSMQGVAPIKLGEYLLCGLPVVATSGIGDTTAVLNEGVGFVVNTGNSNEQLKAAANWFLDTALPERNLLRNRCRSIGMANFSLDKAVNDYRCALRHAWKNIGDR